MRVGLVCPYSLTLVGGVQGQVLGLARTLRARGVEARVLAPCDGPPPESFVTPLGDSIPAVANGSLAPVAPDPAAALRTLRALRDEAFDVVHLHEPLAPGATLTALLFTAAPTVGTFHRSGGLPGVFRTVRPLARWVAGHLAVRCAVSGEAAASAEESYGGHYEQVWNGIELDLYQRTPPWPRSVLAPADRDGADAAGPLILFVGRHEPRKGLAVLIDAMARLGPEAHLWVAGEGPQTDALRAATSGDARIEWLGAIGEEEKRGRMRAADVVCAPSLGGESFGVVVLEAMAAGSCVVASDLAGYRNVARNGKEALLVPAGDPDALAGAVRRAFEDCAMRDGMVEAGTARAALFSMSNLAATYERFYERAAALHSQVGA